MKFKFFGILLLTVFVLLLFFFASLLGENHHIDDSINNYFTKLKAEDFSGKCIPISITSDAVSKTECSNDNFIFILSVLKHFDLLGSKSYTVQLKRSHFWIPYISSDTVAVSLSLSDNTEGGLAIFSNPQYISELFVVKRNNLSWSIHEIRIDDPQLIKAFYHFKKTLDLDKYITKTKTGYIFNQVEIDNSTTTEVDKILLKYNLQKVNEFLK
jgi:hypothetical protein